jgi:hypothetical protein
MHMHFTFVRAGLIRFASYTETLFLETFRMDWLDISIQYHIIYKKKKMNLLDGMIVAIIPISLLLAVIFWMAF